MTTLVPRVTTLHKVPISSAQDFKYAVAYGALLVYSSGNGNLCQFQKYLNNTFSILRTTSFLPPDNAPCAIVHVGA